MSENYAPKIKENPLGTAPLMPLIAKYAIPSVISFLVMSAYNITDQIFIGHVVGMLGNGATNVAFPTVTFATGISMMFGVGTAANFSINQGAKREDEAKKFVHVGIPAQICAGLVVFAIVYIFRMPIIRLCGGTEKVIPLAYSYLSITAFGLPFHMFGNALSNLIRADGSPRYSMLCTVSGALLNVFLDWLFMFPLDLGIRGAAYATIIGQVVSAAVAVAYVPRFRAFKIKIRDFRLTPRYVMRTVAVGAPNTINHMLMMVVNITLNNVLTTYGALSIYGEDIPLAVSGVAAKVNTIMVSFAVGVSQGCQPIYGFNRGAGNIKRVKGTYYRAFLIAFTVGVLFFGCLQTVPRQIISVFGSGDELYFEFAEKYLKTYMMLVFFQNIQPVTINYFSATGNAGQGAIVSLSRQGGFLLPLLVILPKYLGLNGVLIASPIADTCAFIMSVTMVLLSFKRMDRESQPKLR